MEDREQAPVPSQTEPAPDGGTPIEVNANGRHFNCKNCGSSLLYKPGTDHIKCPYCGTINDIPAPLRDSDYLKENDFLAALEAEEKKRENTTSGEAEVVHCDSCGAETTISPDRTSERCPYCGSPLSVQNHYGVKLNVQAVLPFLVVSDKAMAVYREWIRSRWFAPNDFARRATREQALNGIYMPYWTYDADTRTDYDGERGDAYYTTEYYTAVVNGKSEQRSRQVRNIRWSRASGMVDVAFDDILVPASRSLPLPLCDKLAPWRLADLKPFTQDYLSGFVTETYQVGLRDGFEDAKRRMSPHIDSAIRRDIGGDEQRIGSQSTRYDHVTFKHILLPVWLSAYHYNGTTYRFMINAQTGEVSGERPWSWIKITLAVLAGAAAVGGIIYWLYASGAFDNMELEYALAAPLGRVDAVWDRLRRGFRSVLGRVWG